MKNKILTAIVIILLTMTSLYAQNSPIADEWEASPQHKEYLQFMEAGDLKSAMKIKKEKVDAITLRVMKPYLGYFKEKYREMFAKKICDNLPIELNDMLNISFFKAKDILNIDTYNEKERNKLANSFYVFFKVYYEKSGKASFFVNKISKSFPKLKNTELMNTLEAMAEESDIEAAKTPEQKQKEYDDYMKKLRKYNDSKQKQIDSNKKQIDSNKKQIAKWDEIIEKLKGL